MICAYGGILSFLGNTEIVFERKYDAIVKSGIPILMRYDIPSTFIWLLFLLFVLLSECCICLDHLIPPDLRVEIDAKIAAGYFLSGKQVTEADLVKTVGRTWEETEH